MLFIYGSLGLGGIETFFVRLAKERFEQGLITKILLLNRAEDSDTELLAEVKMYATIYYFEDILSIKIYRLCKIPLLAPLNIRRLHSLLDDVSHIHVTGGMTALLANRLATYLNYPVAITVGFYHSLEFSWGTGELPYFERVNREYVLKYLPPQNILLFSKSLIALYQEKLAVDLSNAQTFRIGVINREARSEQKKDYRSQGNKLRICSVGRLVDFKSYNIWMLEVIKQLLESGYDVKYDIYGDGPKREYMMAEIARLELTDVVSLKGSLPYKEFNSTLIEYDLFVGSGTAIIQASSVGVCSIIGIESIPHASTYGFFCDYADHDYNIASLGFSKVSVVQCIKDFVAMDVNEKEDVSANHIKKTEQFYIDNCNFSFEYMKKYTVEVSKSEPYFLYTLSYLFFRLYLKLTRQNIYRLKRELN